jgi:hypothetical protein
VGPSQAAEPLRFKAEQPAHGTPGVHIAGCRITVEWLVGNARNLNQNAFGKCKEKKTPFLSPGKCKYRVKAG